MSPLMGAVGNFENKSGFGAKPYDSEQRSEKSSHSRPLTFKVTSFLMLSLFEF